jgi:hypothetical protein
VIAWGKVHRNLAIHADRVLFDLSGLPLWCLGLNGDGSPKHPLYLPRDTELVRFR